jgi:hypothetical protein
VSRSEPNRLLISTASVLVALSLSLSCQSKLNKPGPEASSSRESTDSQAADLITRVKDAPASSFEKKLPTVRFEDWVRENAGPDWTITWSFTQGPKNEANHAYDFPDSVDIRGDTKDGQYFRLSIGATTNANQTILFWLSGAANVQRGWVGLQHLSQLPRVLHRVGQSSHTSAGQKS